MRTRISWLLLQMIPRGRGAGSGWASAIITCPLDVVKTRLQNTPPGTKYLGTFHTLRTIAQEEGLRALYRGLSASILGYFPTWAVYFTSYEFLKTSYARLLGQNEKNDLIHVLAAMSAGALGTVASSPLWVVRTRLMSQNIFKYRGISDAFAHIWRQEGIKGFYLGLGPSLLGVAHVMVQFPIYEKLKARFLQIQLEREPKNKSLKVQDVLLASIISKLVAGVVTYPHEVIRTRLQCQDAQNPQYRGITHAVRRIVAEEGMRAFYNGLSASLIRMVPAGTITLLSYEILLRAFIDLSNRLQAHPINHANQA